MNYEEPEQTIALPRLLADGRHAVEQGDGVPAAAVFAEIEEMDKKSE